MSLISWYDEVKRNKLLADKNFNDIFYQMIYHIEINERRKWAEEFLMLFRNSLNDIPTDDDE